tara:strand:+ start:404 stop:787 length:384 start_codon:yes stop_codon:yes gene_type:complete
MRKIIADHMLMKINNRLTFIEKNIVQDRDLLIKLIRQSNELFSVVATLHESFEHIMMCMGAPVITENTQEKISENLNESVYIHNDRLLTDFIKGLSSLSGKIKEFEKFEKELEKYKDELTPGTMGES